ncbi:hypothetical protein DL96DRAFT_243854 [Flagelloscypha sp. PMI_526]|nr:hypothetical protein DL96DRAFT_243854 [Flagelloscypha sp. PMI_526]
MAGHVGITEGHIRASASEINILLIDVIVVWRVYCLLPNLPQLRALLLTLLIFTFIFNTFLMVTDYTPMLFIHMKVNLRLGFRIARDVITLFVTVIGAACIGRTAWMFNKSVKKSQLSNHTTSLVSQTFRVLIEGCAILAILQIAVVSLNFTHGGSQIPSMILTTITVFASAIHPCLVTVLVSDAQRSIYSTIGVSKVGTEMSTLPVAPPTAASSSV